MMQMLLRWQRFCSERISSGTAIMKNAQNAVDSGLVHTIII
ncbi:MULTISPECIES: hypothetical protein [unclassified Clostridioides]